jgi:hypothetical protein
MPTENPFFHRGPIHDPDYFFGRQHLLDEVLHFLRHRQSMAIVGPPRIGTTSFLLQLWRLLWEPQTNPAEKPQTNAPTRQTLQPRCVASFLIAIQ